MNDMILDDAMEKMPAYKAKISVDRPQGTFRIGPLLGAVVCYCGMGMMKISDRDYRKVSAAHDRNLPNDIPIQWLTHMYGTKYRMAMFCQPSLQPA